VIRTMPGSANSIAYQIDHLEAFEILGTVAGDDTILIIPREDVTREDVLNVLVKVLPEIAETV
jgi:transcriptional regulator of arginine metabolism